VSDLTVPHATGWFGIAGVVFFAIKLPLWIVPRNPPQITDAAGSAAYLASIGTIALARILLDMGMYVSIPRSASARRAPARSVLRMR
jgi:hypothetical protein